MSADANHPYYLHPCDNLGIPIISMILNENNYNQWCRSMKIVLAVIDGTYLKPAANSPLLVHSTRCDNMVTFWILNSVSVDIRNNSVYMKTAVDIWKDLVIMYSQSNVPKLFQL